MPPYSVQPGDTLSAIAARFGQTLQALVAANPGINPNLIFPGQQITIPGPGTQGTAPFVPSAPGSDAALVEDFNLGPFPASGLGSQPSFPGVPSRVPTAPPATGTGSLTDPAVVGLVDLNDDGIITAADAPGVFGPSGSVGAPPGWTWAFDPAVGDFTLRKFDPITDTSRLDEWIWVPQPGFDITNPDPKMGQWTRIANPEVPDNIWRGLPSSVVPWFMEVMNGRIAVEDVPDKSAQNWIRFFGRAIIEHFTDRGRQPESVPFGLGLPARVLDGSIAADFIAHLPETPATEFPPGFPGSNQNEDQTPYVPPFVPGEPFGPVPPPTEEGQFPTAGPRDTQPATSVHLQRVAPNELRIYAALFRAFARGTVDSIVATDATDAQVRGALLQLGATTQPNGVLALTRQHVAALPSGGAGLQILLPRIAGFFEQNAAFNEAQAVAPAAPTAPPPAGPPGEGETPSGTVGGGAPAPDFGRERVSPPPPVTGGPSGIPGLVAPPKPPKISPIPVAPLKPPKPQPIPVAPLPAPQPAPLSANKQAINKRRTELGLPPLF